MPVPCEVAVTVAPGTTAPEGSLTVPSRLPVAWPNSGALIKKQANEQNARTIALLLPIFNPFGPERAGSQDLGSASLRLRLAVVKKLPVLNIGVWPQCQGRVLCIDSIVAINSIRVHSRPFGPL